MGGLILPDADAGALRLALVRLSCQVQLRRLCRRCAFGLAVPLGLGLGARPLTCVGALVLRSTRSYIAASLDIAAPFLLYKTIAPSQRGLPASAGWGRGGTRTQPSGSADARPLYANHIARRCTLLIFTKDPAPQDRRCGAYCASIYPYAPSQRTSSQPPRSSRTAAGLPAGMVNRREDPASGAS